MKKLTKKVTFEYYKQCHFLKKVQNFCGKNIHEQNTFSMNNNKEWTKHMGKILYKS
jgi:hypothetical protein